MAQAKEKVDWCGKMHHDVRQTNCGQHMKPIWIIDTYLLDQSEYAPTRALPETIERLGYPCLTTKYVPFSEDSDVFSVIPKPAIVYGTHGFIKQSRKHKAISYCREETLRLSEWMPRYSDDVLLNAKGKWQPWGNVVRKPPTETLFIRPDAVTKAFAGTVINANEWEKRILLLEETSGVTDQAWVYLADPKEITAEYRFFIVANTVVTGSQYRRNGILDIRVDVSDGAFSLACDVADHPWQPDDCYVVDIADTPEGQKIIEFNSMSCAGMYACDQAAIIKAVSDQAMRDWAELQYPA